MNPGEDVAATADALRAIGVSIEWESSRDAAVIRGPTTFRDAEKLDCRNSGTTARLMMGVLCGLGRRGTLTGDASLRRRPMERVLGPLRAMGATIVEEGEPGRLPVTVLSRVTRPGDHASPVASAQVKSALLFAGLAGRVPVRIREPYRSRDHTERLLAHLGGRVEATAGGVALEGGQRLRAAPVPLPGDPSSAAFLVVAALLVPGSEIVVRDVGVNPTRTGFLAILRRMGGAIELARPREVAGEPRADIHVRASELRGTSVGPEEVPAAIDELPVLCVAAALATGETCIRGAAELRVKESDRIAAVAQLRRLGVGVRTTADGLVIEGSGGRPLGGGTVASHGDHRIAMAFAVAGLAATGGVAISDAACVDVSFPGFFARLRELGAPVEADGG
jgi:3-phosphoshikimate 1-carboxyvinyltransferase